MVDIQLKLKHSYACDEAKRRIEPSISKTADFAGNERSA